MTDSNLTPSPDEAPAVDTAEEADGHPQTEGMEVGDFGTGDSEFGEDPDVETHIDEGAGAIDPSI